MLFFLCFSSFEHLYPEIVITVRSGCSRDLSWGFDTRHCCIICICNLLVTPPHHCRRPAGPCSDLFGHYGRPAGPHSAPFSVKRFSTSCELQQGPTAPFYSLPQRSSKCNLLGYPPLTAGIQQAPAVTSLAAMGVQHDPIVVSSLWDAFLLSAYRQFIQTLSKPFPFLWISVRAAILHTLEAFCFLHVNYSLIHVHAFHRIPTAFNMRN